jgi:hypothetical protein
MKMPLGNMIIIDSTTGIPIVDKGINFGATGEEEIWQCAKYILLVPIRSVCLDRELGMNFTMVDKPKPVAKIMWNQEATMKLSLFEPRVQFVDTIFRGEESIEGNLNPEVKIRLIVTT